MRSAGKVVKRYCLVLLRCTVCVIRRSFCHPLTSHSPPNNTQGKRGGAMNMQGRGATFEESLGNVVKVSLARWGQFHGWDTAATVSCSCMHGAARLSS